MPTHFGLFRLLKYVRLLTTDLVNMTRAIMCPTLDHQPLEHSLPAGEQVPLIGRMV